MIRTAFPFLLLAMPALAQTPDCGGIGTAGAWIGGEEAASDIAGAAGPFDAAGRTPLAGHLVHLFTLSEPGEVRIEANPTGGGDPQITLYSATGTALAENDDFGGGFGSRIETGLEPGAYCLSTRDVGGLMTDVALRVGRTEHPALGPSEIAVTPSEPADGEACSADILPDLTDTAIDAASLDAVIGAVGTVAEAPAWRLDLDEALRLTITATMEDGDPLIRLRNEAGMILEENDDADGLNARIDRVTPLPAGRYCLEVEDIGNDGTPVALQLMAYDPGAARLRGLNAAEFAPTSEDEVEIAAIGPVETSLLHDVPADAAAARWFTFEMPEDGLVAIEAIGQGVDPALTLFDRVGRKLGENDDGPDSLDSFLATRLRPGSYTLAVRAVRAGEVGNIRLLLERYVPAR